MILKNIWGINLHTLLVKLDRFIEMQNFSAIMKRYSTLQEIPKGLSKRTYTTFGWISLLTYLYARPFYISQFLKTWSSYITSKDLLFIIA